MTASVHEYSSITLVLLALPRQILENIRVIPDRLGRAQFRNLEI